MRIDPGSIDGHGASGPRARVVLVVLGFVMLATCWRLWLTHGAEPALFWDSPSYLEYAEEWLSDPGYFMTPRFRPFGYPLLILLSSGLDLGRLEGVVVAQHLLGLASQILLVVGVFYLSRSLTLAVALGVVSCLFVDLVFMEVVVYSETLALAVTTALACLLVRILGPQPEEPLSAMLLGVVASMSVFVRPVMLIALPVVLAAVTAAALLRLRTWRVPALFAGVCLFLVGGYGLHTRDGTLRFDVVDSAGLNLLTWVGFPSVYHNLPPEMDHIRRACVQQASERGRNDPKGLYAQSHYLSWAELIEAVTAAESAAGRPDYPPWNRVATRVTFNAFRALPREFSKLWWGVVREYLGEYTLSYGLWRTAVTPRREDAAQVSPLRFRVAMTLASLWKRLTPWLSGAALLLPVVLLCTPSVPVRLRLALGAVAALAVVVMATNTILEPAHGQARYRMPFQLVYLMLAGTSGWLLISSWWLRLRHQRP